MAEMFIILAILLPLLVLIGLAILFQRKRRRGGVVGIGRNS